MPSDPSAHRLIELIEYSLGRWAPADPAADLFNGNYLLVGGFVRLDLVLDGLVNPPGDVKANSFDPFAFGPHPVFGFVEVDIDADVETGGELDAPQYRYLGNIVRFGSKPVGPEFSQRVASDQTAFDGQFLTPPFVERHGEEFHLALLGGQFGIQDVTEISGDGDATFEAGEVWDIVAPVFHRAHGYEPFSFAEGGAYPGEYSPDVTLRFSHDIETDRTHVTLVFPLDNLASALMRSEVPEINNADPSDQASVLESLVDLQESAQFIELFPTGLPEEAIILGWRNKNPSSYLDPTAWRATVLLGTSYTAAAPSGERFIWTDAWPDGLRGDVDGDDSAGTVDRGLIQQYITAHDAADGQIDGKAGLPGFAEAFNVYDVNHDGTVDVIDQALVSPAGDLDADEDVDLGDFAAFQVCLTIESADPGWTGCVLGDLDADGDVDAVDGKRFVLALSGS